MSEEEKKAINDLIDIREFGNLSSYLDLKKEQLNSINIVLNLIEKQQKEIKELKENQTIFKELKEELKPLVKGEYISKDKIRKIIAEEFIMYDAFYRIKKLVEE